MNQLLLIGAGGAAGALGRYWVSTLVYGVMGKGFPWGTLVVNLFGSLVMGFLYVWLLERTAVSADLRALLMIGFRSSPPTVCKALRMVGAQTSRHIIRPCRAWSL